MKGVQGNEPGGSKDSEQKSCPDGRLCTLKLCSTMGFLVPKGNLFLLLCASFFPGKFEKAPLPLLRSSALPSLIPLKDTLHRPAPVNREFP